VPILHLSLGIALYKGGSLAEGEKELNRALDLDPQAAPAYFYRALVYARRGERQKAIADLETVVALDPHYREAHAELAQLYSADGQSEKAAAALAKELADMQREKNEDERMNQRHRELRRLLGGFLDIQ
jgi:Tfp pilus assembly protein PilF